MRTEVAAGGTTITVGELLKALDGVHEAAPVYLTDAKGNDWCLHLAVGMDLAVSLSVDAYVSEDIGVYVDDVDD